MIRFDGETLTLTQSQQSVAEHRKATNTMFGMPVFETRSVDSTGAGSANQHAHVLQNFVDACLDDTPLVTQAQEGLASLQLANGILLSAWKGKPVDLPLDATRYEKALQERVSESSLRKPSDRKANIDMNESFR